MLREQRYIRTAKLPLSAMFPNDRPTEHAHLLWAVHAASVLNKAKAPSAPRIRHISSVAVVPPCGEPLGVCQAVHGVMTRRRSSAPVRLMLVVAA
jgi:hypothetical protein